MCFQTKEIGLGATSTDQNLLKLEFGYNSTTSNHDDNGAMLSQKITVPTDGANTGFVNMQTYAYDNLNRLHSAQEKDAGNNQTWKQTFQYDRYGNRRFDAANTTTLGTSPNQNAQNPLINTANNRIDDNQGYIYDANGNLTQDANNLATPNYLYDAESRQKEIKDPNGVSRGIYLYDGEGKRVKKKTDFEETIFVYDGGGQLAAEYSTQTSSTPQTSYLTTDHLGSPRITTDQSGAVKSRKDFSAFGDETKTAQRTSGLHYLPDTVHQPETARQDYTGYQKDEESNLEYAQARYYNPGHGRFTSVDPLTASASIKDPQTFNRYSYVLNSPYKFTDPLGLLPTRANTDKNSNFSDRIKCDCGLLTEKDLTLLQFHIANGTALGYNIQNAMQSRISQQQSTQEEPDDTICRANGRCDNEDSEEDHGFAEVTISPGSGTVETKTEDYTDEDGNTTAVTYNQWTVPLLVSLFRSNGEPVTQFSVEGKNKDDNGNLIIRFVAENQLTIRNPNYSLQLTIQGGERTKINFAIDFIEGSPSIDISRDTISPSQVYVPSSTINRNTDFNHNDPWIRSRLSPSTKQNNGNNSIITLGGL